MARYSPDHKTATRRRMIETAGRRFKRDGFDGSGISTLVGDAGLTNGAFYGHFDSKDDLIADVVADQLAGQVARLKALPRSRASWPSTSPPSTVTTRATAAPPRRCWTRSRGRALPPERRTPQGPGS